MADELERLSKVDKQTGKQEGDGYGAKVWVKKA